MNTKGQNNSDDYFRLRENIDKRVQILEQEHKKHLRCKSGCDLCCMDYNIFPVEFYSILQKLKEQKFKLQPTPTGEDDSSCCVFLKNHNCTIYQSRPIICRTHGLPLLYTNEDDEWELSTCELNFTRFDFSRFSEKNTFAQDVYNSKLFVLNQNFIAKFSDKDYNETDLIPLKSLTKYL